MPDQIFNKVQQILLELDTISLEQSINSDHFKNIQRSLEDQMRDLEIEDFDAYAYYKYLIAEKYLLKIQLSEQQKKAYHNQLGLYREKFFEYQNKLKKEDQNNNNKNNNNNDNNNKGEIDIFLEKINKLIEKIIQKDEQSIQELKQLFQSIRQINVIVSVNEFFLNNSIFQEIYENAQLFELKFNEDNSNLSEDEQKYNFQIFGKVFEQFFNLTSILNLEFYQKIYDDKNFKNKYYGENIIDQEDFQNKRKFLLKIIHPDKSKIYIKSNKNQCYEKAIDIMRKLTKRNQDWEKEIKESLLNLEQKQLGFNLIQDYQTKAKIYFNEANRLQKICQNNQQNRSQLKEAEIKKNQAAKESFKFYRQAMKQADKLKIIEQSIILRNNISLCFYLMKNFILAQIYATGSLCILKKNKKMQNRYQLFEETIKVLNKIRGQKSQQFNQEQSDKDQQLMLLNSQNNYENINSLVIQQLNELKLEPFNQILMLRYEISDECDIQDQLNFESTEVTKLKKLQTSCIKSTAAILLGGSVFIDFGCFVLASIGSIGWFSLAAIPIILYNTKNNVDSFKKISQKADQNIFLRNKLNMIIKEAIELHKQGQFYEFLQKMQTQLNEINQKLIKVDEEQYLNIDYSNFIDILLENGFRPDSVAYLLVLVGEAILFCNKFNSKYFTDQKSIAMGIYKNVLINQKLTQQAQDVDLLIQKLIAQNAKKNNYFSQLFCRNNFEKFSDCFDDDLKVDSRHSIAHYDIKQKKYQSYEKKMKEIRDIAKINICLIYILNKNIEEAKGALSMIINQTNTNEFVDMKREYKIQALCDFIQIFDTEFNPNIEENQSNNNQQLGNEECAKIKVLREYVEQEKLDQALNQIYKLTKEKEIFKTNFNNKLFYYWCIICYKKLNKNDETIFYIDKYKALPRKDLDQDQQIYQIEQKIQ